MTAADIAYVIRRAVAEDEAAIQALVRSERLNPHGLHFAKFAVAVRDDELIGAPRSGTTATGRSNSDPSSSRVPGAVAGSLENSLTGF